jgi:hypothetical protein
MASPSALTSGTRTFRIVTIAVCFGVVLVGTTIALYRVGWDTPNDITGQRSGLAECVSAFVLALPATALQCSALYLYAKSIQLPATSLVTGIGLLAALAYVYRHPQITIWKPGELLLGTFMLLMVLWWLIVGVAYAIEWSEARPPPTIG